jgi:putative spermidine/putrescine transport system permease protein
MNATRIPMLVAPLVAVFAAFFLLPMTMLVIESVSAGGVNSLELYITAVTSVRYMTSLGITILLSLAVTAATLILAGVVGVFLARNVFKGRGILLSILTFPLAFPGVVVGFMIILLVGRQGLAGDISKALTGDKIVIAYSLAGLFLGYLYFSIPRVFSTVMAAAEKLDVSLEEAARSLGAGPWQVLRDVIIPSLAPALVSSGAICFATSMGAFGTAFTLAAGIDVLPITIYTEFTLSANIAMASALSIILGIITWLTLLAARWASGEQNIGAAAG